MPARTAPRRWDGVSSLLRRVPRGLRKGRTFPWWARKFSDARAIGSMAMIPYLNKRRGFSTIGRQAGLWPGQYALWFAQTVPGRSRFLSPLAAYAVPQAALPNKINKH
jgi:hypothetical protein